MDSFHQIVTKALESRRSPEEISLMETEEKFSSLALAFRTDRHTLDKRIELHLRARDVAEKNIQKELESLKDGIKVLNQSCNSGQSNQQTFAKIHGHLEVLEQSITRMSSRAEDHGAVQQEMRVSQVIEVMVQHVENLKRVYETEHAELQEASRKAMSMTKSESTESTGSNKAGDRTAYGATGTGKGSLRRISLALMAKNPKPTRKISIQSDCLIPSTAPSRSEFQPSFFSDNNKSSLDSGSEETSTGPGEKNYLNRQSSILTMAESIGSGVRNGSASARDERDAKYSNRLTLKMRGTSKESLSNSVDDKTAKDAICQRHSVRSYLAWLMASVRVLVPRSDESGKCSFLFRALSTLLLLKTYFGYVVVLTLLSLGFFLLIYHWWMVPDYL